MKKTPKQVKKSSSPKKRKNVKAQPKAPISTLTPAMYFSGGEWKASPFPLSGHMVEFKDGVIYENSIEIKFGT
jgi:hypothetical protein